MTALTYRVEFNKPGDDQFTTPPQVETHLPDGSPLNMSTAMTRAQTISRRKDYGTAYAVCHDTKAGTDEGHIAYYGGRIDHREGNYR